MQRSRAFQPAHRTLTYKLLDVCHNLPPHSHTYTLPPAMTSSLRKLKAMVLGHNLDMTTTAATLEEAAVPVSRDDCRACADPCDVGM